ncbi:hypothetical protein [Actinoplanes regularis]|uniref:Uncharacterized protein n=1 Tax=Actinoplanes regularis TaxID=52697 RepID=A0A239DS73_9ACTN|nr:hypothetical protein [Actinoplanes regularis]GIE89028.1 hypothetical protein Are01nite_55080 [Actinoplanes regularis]SNS35340.1 hypothetical protein SAMN06264365_11477 [Actinoplanes regularis]
MPSSNRRWIWAGRVVFGLIVVALAVYLASVGIDEADKRASGIAAVLALVTLGAPYLLPRPGGVPAIRVEDSGDATATRGGEADSGVRLAAGSGAAHVTRSGNASADGPGSIANTGVRHGAQR